MYYLVPVMPSKHVRTSPLDRDVTRVK